MITGQSKMKFLFYFAFFGKKNYSKIISKKTYLIIFYDIIFLEAIFPFFSYEIL